MKNGFYSAVSVLNTLQQALAAAINSHLDTFYCEKKTTTKHPELFVVYSPVRSWMRSELKITVCLTLGPGHIDYLIQPCTVGITPFYREKGCNDIPCCLNHLEVTRLVMLATCEAVLALKKGQMSGHGRPRLTGLTWVWVKESRATRRWLDDGKGFLALSTSKVKELIMHGT